MGVSLEKGGRVSLDKAAPGLRTVQVGLGWDPRVTDGKDFDLDASAFLLGQSGKVSSDQDFIFYNNLQSADGSVRHTGDNLTGAGEGDDEVIMVDLPAVPTNVQKIAFTVTIHDAQARGQNFGQVANSFIRLVDADNGTEVVRFDLGEDYSTETAMVFAELYRHEGEWRFNAVGQGYAGGLRAMCEQYGVRV